MSYLIRVQYFSKDTVSPIDNQTHFAGSLGCFVQDGSNMESPIFVFSADFMNEDGSLKYTFINTFTISDVNYTLSVVFDDVYGFQCVFDYPHYFLVDNSALVFLAGLLGSSGGTTDTSLLTSLNGNFGSYPDGVQVVVQGLTTRTYTVQSSSLGWDSPSTGSLIITYRLKDADDNFLEAPHVLLTLKA